MHIFFQILEISYHNYKMIRLNKKNIMQRDSKKCGIGRRLLESSFGFKWFDEHEKMELCSVHRPSSLRIA